MSRPPLRVADVLKTDWTEQGRWQVADPHTRKVLGHLLTCRTAALGGRLHRCNRCGAEVPLYNSCQDRHCPTCQTMRKQQWLERRHAELLPVPYFHVVFTLPHLLNDVVNANRRRLLGEFFATVGWVLQRFAVDPQWKLCGQLGFIGVLHTWTQKLLLHFHVHCLVPGGAWDAVAGVWRCAHPAYLFGKQALAKAFQARFIRRLERLRRADRLRFDGAAAPLAGDSAWNTLLQNLWQTPWIVYPKATARKPEQTLDYLGRYTHRVAIADHRILRLTDGQVTFAWRDRTDHNRAKTCTLPVEQFAARFRLHILPHGFTKVRAFGFLSGRHKTATLAAIRATLGVAAPPSAPTDERTAERILRLTGIDVAACPFCKVGRLSCVAQLPRARDGPP